MSKILFGIDRVEKDENLLAFLKGQKVGLVANPASVNQKLVHSLDVLSKNKNFQLTCAFGPQHGMRGEKQYNMIESEDYLDPIRKIPVFSLYGESRRPTEKMLSHCDAIIFDLQDVGCRIYTYLTTLLYVLEAGAQYQKKVVVLDRPNPAGRAQEGSLLKVGQESFVGAGPILMRHGFTLGEMASWFKDYYSLSVDLKVISMENYFPNHPQGYGWPIYDRAWVNPSPNLPTLSSTRTYPGTVMLEGTTLSEGRGTTRPLEGFGAPDLGGEKILKEIEKFAPQVLQGAKFRPFYFQPTFYKYQDQLCSGIQIHTDDSDYRPELFKPYRFMAAAFKIIKKLRPDYPLWRNFPYEYVYDRLAIDVITGSDVLRKWVDDPQSSYSDLEYFLQQDEKQWNESTKQYVLYP